MTTAVEQPERVREIRIRLRDAALLAASVLLVANFAALFSLSACLPDHPSQNGSGVTSGEGSEPCDYVSPYDGSLGTAGSLTGRTMIVSIFTDDLTVCWDPDSEQDSEMIYDTLDNLRISTAFLTEQAARYGSDAEFIFDWELCPDLRLSAKFDDWLVTEYGDKYDVQRQWVRDNVDTDGLRTKYRADNVIYLFFFNTPFSNQVNPWYLGYSCSPDYDVEFCNIYVRFDDCFISKPATYAHEMLHCFGAHDLYYANEFITQEYVDYCFNNYCNDIMYTVSDSKDIFNEFSDLDAYYVGIIDSCDEVDQWGLAQSEHLQAEIINR